MKKLVVLTGSGISAESGIPTFRGSGGLWEGHDIMEVASPEGWHRDPELVLDFYNQRRKKAAEAQPNRGHELVAELEKHFRVSVVTQNVDNLHERAGSTNIIHLHGSLFEARSSVDPGLVYSVEGKEIHMGDLCDKGSQLRPNVVWFGEMVPLMETAVREVLSADVFLVVGTSLVIYPAAGLVDYVDGSTPTYVVDPNMPDIAPRPNLNLISEPATRGMEVIFDDLVALS